MRILIAGLGAIGQRHARNLRQLCGADIDLLAYRRRRLPFIVTDSLERDDSRNVEEALGIRAYDALDEALAAAPHIVLVCNPTSQHLGVAERAVAAGCHIFIEKPVSHGIDGVDRLRATVIHKRLTAGVGCQWRYHPCVLWLKDVLESQALGTLLHADFEYAEYLPDWHPYEDYRTSYAARADLGGGVVLTQIHDYDLAYWLFGPPATVSAEGGQWSSLAIDVEDTVDARLEGGRVPVRVRQTFASRVKKRNITVVGERATLTVDLLSARGVIDPPVQESFVKPDYVRNDMYLHEMKNFLERVRGCDTPIVSLDDGIAVLSIALAIKQAMRSGASVALRRGRDDLDRVGSI